MYKVKIEKLSTNDNKFRTSCMEGLAPRLPSPGESFVVLGEGLQEGVRVFNTSIVKDFNKFQEGDFTVYEIQTLNSSYKVTVLSWPENVY